MIILLQGKDSYLQKRTLDQIISNHSQARVIFFEFETEKTILDLLKKEVRQESIFQEKKILVVIGLLEQIGLNKEIVSFLSPLAKTDKTTIILVENKTVFKHQLFNKIYNTEPLKLDSLKKWITNEIQLRGGEIEERALQALIQAGGSDLWLISNEIDKLIAYKKGGKISINDVNLLIRPQIENNIFQAIDFIGQKDKKNALKMFYSHLKKGDSVSYLLAMIGFHFRTLILVKSGADSQKLGIHPFVFRKALNQARFFSQEKLKNIYRQIIINDIKIKTGQIEEKTALDLLIFGI